MKIKTITGSSLRWHNGVLQYMARVSVDGIPAYQEWMDIPTYDVLPKN